MGQEFVACVYYSNIRFKKLSFEKENTVPYAKSVVRSPKAIPEKMFCFMQGKYFRLLLIYIFLILTNRFYSDTVNLHVFILVLLFLFTCF